MASDAVSVLEDECMNIAVEEASKARLIAPPNPWVGALLVLPGQSYRGHTHGPGGPHAEIDAISGANGDLSQGTLYVTLEPCSHHGRTPPCAEAIVEAGIKRVVVGVVDPDPRVRGRGIEFLRSNGVEVKVGVQHQKVKDQLAPYLKQRSTSLPWVVLKLAVTIDGRIAANDGSSKWITGAEARTRVQEIRSHSDVIIAGANTIRVDDPRLDVRIAGVSRQPRRIILGKIPDDASVAPAEEFVGDESELLSSLGASEVLQILVEGGSKVAKRFLDQGLVDEFIFHIAPAIFGGSDGISAFGGQGPSSMEQVSRFHTKDVRRLGQDIEVVLWPAKTVDLLDRM